MTVKTDVRSTGRRIALALALTPLLLLWNPAASFAEENVGPTPPATTTNSPTVKTSETGSKVTPAIALPPDPQTGCIVYPGGIYGCWWERSGYRGATLSIPAVKFAKDTTCGYYDLTANPSGWANRISAVANWTRSPHYYYNQKNAKGSRLTVAAFTSKSSLSSTFDNRILSMTLTCYAA